MGARPGRDRSGNRTAPRVLYYVPTYLRRTERFIWQQARDIPNVRVAALDLLPSGHEFPLPRCSVVRPQSRISRSVDYRLGRRIGLSGRRDVRLTPWSAARLSGLLLRSDLAYAMFVWNATDLLEPARLTRTPLVVHAAGSDVTTAGARGPAYLARALRVFDQAALVLCGSRFLREAVIELGAPPEKCEVHYLGIDVPEDVDREISRDARLSVTVVGRLHPVKGVDRSMRAFAEGTRGCDARLTVVGDGPERGRLVRLALELGISDRVHFAGERSHQGVYDVLRTTDIFLQHNVTTSDGGAEGLGGTLLEAAAHGVPVVASASGGAPEALIDGVSGFLVAEGDLRGMAEMVSRLASDPSLRQHMGARGREFVQERHDARRQNAALARRLSALVERRSLMSG
jgi:glycosyltransferase involved in cell wall biosynthesis